MIQWDRLKNLKIPSETILIFHFHFLWLSFFQLFLVICLASGFIEQKSLQSPLSIVWFSSDLLSFLWMIIIVIVHFRLEYFRFSPFRGISNSKF